MSLLTRDRLTSRRAMLSMGLVIPCTIAFAQPQASGRVINRDGAPQGGCQIEFRVANVRRYVATSNNDGRFYLTANPGTYNVFVMRGQQVLGQLSVTVDDRGLHPSTLVV
jgi:hypothetical protein